MAVAFSVDPRARNHLTHGHTVGKHQSRTYLCWRSMMNRCDSPKNKRYACYGGRGISYDPCWKVFDNFVADMGICPDGMSIDRKNNNLGYSKENCRWATSTDQARNRRSTKFLTYNGETLPVVVWAEKVGIRYKTLWYRLSIGTPLRLALRAESLIGNKLQGGN